MDNLNLIMEQKEIKNRSELLKKRLSSLHRVYSNLNFSGNFEISHLDLKSLT